MGACMFQGIAKSITMKKILSQAERYASIPRPVLIRGERGTGKELMARYIHNSSPRKENPFVAINCAAFNNQLLNSEIYGHEKGAFTGADSRKIGQLERADGGTLFMDEIGNMSIEFQEKILRVMEYQKFQRISGTEMIEVDVRIVSATNADVIGDEPISHKGKVVGWVTSGGYAHTSGVSVAQGYVPKEIADEEYGWEIEILDEHLSATLQARPLFDSNSGRMRS